MSTFAVGLHHSNILNFFQGTGIRIHPLGCGRGGERSYNSSRSQHSIPCPLVCGIDLCNNKQIFFSSLVSLVVSNINVNIRHTYWAPLNPVTEHAVELTLFLWHMPEGVAKRSFLGCNHQSTCMPSYSLYIHLLWYLMYYPGGMKARVSPVHWSEPHSILAPTQDSNPGGRIDRFRIISGDHYTTTAHNDCLIIIGIIIYNWKFYWILNLLPGSSFSFKRIQATIFELPAVAADLHDLWWFDLCIHTDQILTPIQSISWLLLKSTQIFIEERLCIWSYNNNNNNNKKNFYSPVSNTRCHSIRA